MSVGKQAWKRWACRSVLVASVLGFAGVSWAQDGSGRLSAVPVTVSKLNHLWLTPQGPRDGPPVTSRSCNGTSQYTDASFSNGQYLLEAGLAEHELMAQTYVLTAADFPIKIDSIDFLFATSNATQSTTTQWSVLFFSGTPTTGTLVRTESSDGTIIPHIELGQGTNGTDVNFSVDPGDPDQIIINDDGTHSFTVAIRIDKHNNQTGNPCFQGPGTCCNAFPVVDTSGVASLTGNWLYGLNCGSLGCPSNGGWAKFSQLAAGLCRPSGDWVMKAAWERVNCVSAGACCLPDGSCSIKTQGDCAAASGTYQGDGTDCSTTNCPQPRGACCFSNGFCLQLTSADCTSAGGHWNGANTACNGNTCPTGACCLPSGQCITATQSQCTAQNGTFKGVGTTCANANCPQPKGACCVGGGFCLLLTASDCNGIPGSSWAGAGTTCADNNNNGIADVCEPACGADFNGDGFVDIFDFTAYVTCFEGGACPSGKTADFNGDGFADIFDYTDFVTACEKGS